MKEATVRALPRMKCGNREYFVDERATEKSIVVPSEDREGRPEEACLYGSEYYALEDGVVGALMKEGVEESR